MGKSGQYWILLSSKNSRGRWRRLRTGRRLEKCVCAFQRSRERFGNSLASQWQPPNFCAIKATFSVKAPGPTYLPLLHSSSRCLHRFEFVLLGCGVVERGGGKEPREAACSVPLPGGSSAPLKPFHTTCIQVRAASR